MFHTSTAFQPTKFKGTRWQIWNILLLSIVKQNKKQKEGIFDDKSDEMKLLGLRK